MRGMFFLQIYSACHLKVTSYFKILHRVIGTKNNLSLLMGRHMNSGRNTPHTRREISFVEVKDSLCLFHQSEVL